MLARYAVLLIATGRAPTHRPAAVQIHGRRPASAATATSTLSCLSSLLRVSIGLRLCHQHICILTRNLVSPFAIIWARLHIVYCRGSDSLQRLVTVAGDYRSMSFVVVCNTRIYNVTRQGSTRRRASSVASR